MKWMVLIGAIMAGTLTLAFMTPDPQNGELLSFKPLKEAFATGSFIDALQEKTPSRVITVSGNSAAHLAGRALGSASKMTGPVIDSAKDKGTEQATSLIPKTNEQQRDEIIVKLEDKIEKLEEANEEETAELKKELDSLLEELKAVKEDNSFLESIVEKISPEGDGCECSVENNE